jgi:ABC-type transport system involved in multi-copper enzyme maturation permease subunit
MAGIPGLTKTEINPKCVLFSIIVIFLYFYRPPETSRGMSLLTGSLIFVIAYVSMAWYDHFYECIPLKGGQGITSVLKPKRDANDKKNTKERQEIAIFHMFVVSWLIHLAFYGMNPNNQSYFLSVLALAAFTLLYHARNL